MLFAAQTFVLGFLPPVLIAFYALAGRPVARQLWMIAASLAFYGAWDARFVPALVALTVANWGVAEGFRRTGRRGVLSAGVAMNLAVLGVCKYTNFVGAMVFGGAWVAVPIILPLGVSFFTFQKIGYLVDLKRGANAFYGLREFVAFVTFFPQLIAGPLVRHSEMIPQLRADPRAGAAENVSRGAVLFFIGFAKKLLLADTLGLTADPLFARAASGEHLGAAAAWAAAGCYALQIYFDFSGYSDMAIGLARMFGLRLAVNFAAPYQARSIRDFWRRWHITLSRFLRDYVYVPLGGNRRRRVVNVVATMLLGGLWHGAAWTFVAWGGLHGVALAVNGAWPGKLPPLAGRALTLVFVTIAWVFFRAPDFATAGRMLQGIAFAHGVGTVRVAQSGVVWIAAALALLGVPSQRIALSGWLPLRWLAYPAGLAAAALIVAAGGRAPSEFIYFQF